MKKLQILFILPLLVPTIESPGLVNQRLQILRNICPCPRPPIKIPQGKSCIIGEWVEYNSNEPKFL